MRRAGTFIAFFLLSAGAAPALNVDVGASLQSAAGISPLLVIVETSAGLVLGLTVSDVVGIESTTSAGYSFLYVQYQPRNWFHVSQELGVSFNFLLGTARSWVHHLSVIPGLYFSISPGVYMLYGPGLHIRYEFARSGGITFGPAELLFRVLFRDTVLGYRWHVQAGLRLSLVS
jgi:hypothetical protein